MKNGWLVLMMAVSATAMWGCAAKDAVVTKEETKPAESVTPAASSPTSPVMVPVKAVEGPKVEALPAAGVLPAGWVASLNGAVAGITPICSNLWPGDAPNQNKTAKPETDNNTRIYGVSIPGVMVYVPAKDKQAAAGGTCVIECMGGSYDHLTRLVGADNTVAVFAPKGITVISLKYRLKPATTDVERDAVTDGKRAIRFARAHAKELGIDPAKIGLLGWSAGGNLILSLTTHLENNGAGDPKAEDAIERESCRPDFVTLLSPWPNGKTIAAYALGNQTPPPAFMGSARDDTTAPFTFAQAIQAEWEKAGGKMEFVPIDTGGHGAYELLTGTAKDWPDKFLPWLEKAGFWKKVQ